MKIVVLSDCHLGSPEANVQELTQFLYQLSRDRCDRVILLGDVWDYWHMKVDRLRIEFRDIIDILRRFRLDYVIGNHDVDYVQYPVIPGLLPVASLRLTIKGRNIILLHGHQYDSICRKITGRITDNLNVLFRKITGWSFKDTDWVKYSCLAKRLRKKSRQDAMKLGLQLIIVGHSHLPECLGDDGLPAYMNCGDWKRSNTYIQIEDDVVELRQWVNRQSTVLCACR